MPSAAQKLGAQVAEKQKALQTFFDSHKSKDAERPYDMTKEDVEQVKAWNDELNDLGTKWQDARELEDIDRKNREIGAELSRIRKPGPDFLATNDRGEVKTFGEVVIGALYDKEGNAIKGREIEVADYGSPEMKGLRDLEQKTTMTTGAGWAPATIRSNRVSMLPLRPVVFMDILPTIPLTTGQVYQYMQEVTFTNNAASVAEAAAYPESALAANPVNANVVKVGTLLPITEEQLSDVDGMRAYADNRLGTMVLLAADNQLLNATGGSDINGFYNQVTQTQAKGTDPVFDAIFKAMVLVRTVGFANPDAVVLHPLDYQDIRLTRTADGLYIMGNPDVAGSDRLFGVRIVQTTAATQNTGLVGDFNTHSALITRWGLDIKASDSHVDTFGKDIWTLKARIRLGLAIFRLLAFAKVTGI